MRIHSMGGNLLDLDKLEFVSEMKTGNNVVYFNYQINGFKHLFEVAPAGEKFLESERDRLVNSWVV